MKKHVENLFSKSKNNCSLLPFGCETILKLDSSLGKFLNDNEQANNTSYLLEYLPDYILIDSNKNKLYFIEVKFSNHPLIYGERMIQIKNQANYATASSMTIGVLAREAFYSYRKFFPETILIYACPYSEIVLFAQSIDKLPAIYVENNENKVVNSENYDKYEIGSNNYFHHMRNDLSKGSGTPSVNFCFDDMEPIEAFFKTLNIDLDCSALKNMFDETVSQTVYFDKTDDGRRCKEFFETRIGIMRDTPSSALSKLLLNIEKQI